MEHHPLESLISLIEFDKDVIKHEQALRIEQNALDSLGKDLDRLVHEREDVLKRLTVAKKEVHEYELTMKELDANEQEKRKQLDSVSAQAVYDALRKEINFLKKAQYDHERQLVQRWKMLEVAQKAFDEQELATKSKTEAINKKVQEHQTRVSTLKQELDSLYHERVPKEQGVPQEWLVKYNVMRAHTTDPIVSVELDCCGGCFAQLPPQDLADLRQKRLIQCSSCYRFIYMPEKMLHEEPESPGE